MLLPTTQAPTAPGTSPGDIPMGRHELSSVIGRHSVQPRIPSPKLGKSHSSVVSNCTVAFGDTWPDAPRHPQPALCMPRPDHLQKALNTSKQKLKINKTVSQHSPQGEPGFARVAGTHAAGIGRSDPCQPKEPMTCFNPGRQQPLQPRVRTADAPRGHPLSHGEGQDRCRHTHELAGREPCPEGSHCLFGTYAPHNPPFPVSA